MLVLYVLAGYAALGTWIAWLVSRRRKDNEVIAALRRQFAHVDAKREAAERAAAVAEEQCLQALQNAELAMEVAGDVRVVGQRVQRLIDCTVGPAAAGTGRHGAPASRDYPAIAGGAGDNPEGRG